MNCVLVGSLALLLVQRFFRRPELPAGWINEAGGVLGFVALASVTGLSLLVWRTRLLRYRVCFVCVFGLVLAAFLASVVDKSSFRQPWFAMRTILIGATAVVAGSFAWLAAGRWRKRFAGSFGTPCKMHVPLLLSGGLALAFGVRGAWSDPFGFWLYFGCLSLLLVVTVAYGMLFRSAWASVVATTLVLIASVVLVVRNPASWFGDFGDQINLPVAGLASLAITWIAGFLFERAQLKRLDEERRLVAGRTVATSCSPARTLGRRGFMAMPNIAGLVAANWIFIASLLESFASPRGHVLLSPTGIVATVLTAGLLTMQLWNVRGRFLVLGRYLCCLGLAFLCATLATKATPDRLIATTFASACSVMAWGIAWTKRDAFERLAGSLRVPRLAAGRRAFWKQVPMYDLLVIVIVMVLVAAAMFGVEKRPLRYLTGVTPLFLGMGLAPLAVDRPRRGLQWLSIGLATIAWVFVAWADLTPSRSTQLSILARTLIALGTAVFAYGWLVPKRIGPNSKWLASLREAALGTCICALPCFAILIVFESLGFQPEVGSGLPLSTAAAVAVVVISMILGLLAIAVLPQHDPLSLSIEYRRGYVYAAQVVGAMLIGHLYLSMPFLFQLGIKQYWPYIAMLLSFGGVGLARLLRKRDLEVLGQPIFHSAAVLPVVASCAFWAIDSRADAAMVMLLAGAIYLTISLTQASLLSGAATVVFGNLALWLFYGKFPGLDFFQHPQLWLIPPAISVLVASRIHRDRLTPAQHATLRYLCVAVIYVSSTSEIILTGLGDKLWPPMVLALLSVGGIFAGIMLQVRAYLYLGSLFLLMSVVSMVSHAHQRLEHVWPWWAFGIGLGTAILVMFGLFEKRGNELRSISGRLASGNTSKSEMQVVCGYSYREA